MTKQKGSPVAKRRSTIMPALAPETLTLAVSELTHIADRLVTQAQLLQFQLKTVNMRLDALEKIDRTATRRRRPTR